MQLLAQMDSEPIKIRSFGKVQGHIGLHFVTFFVVRGWHKPVPTRVYLHYPKFLVLQIRPFLQ